MKAIFSVDKNWGIGKNGGLLLRLKKDMQYFRDMTIGHTVVMGKKTYLSLPKGALPNRRNIVLSRSGFVAPDAEVVDSVDALLALLGEQQADAFVCGGGEVYRLLLPYTDTIYVTKFDAVFDPDTFFPNLDEMPEWELKEQSAPMEEKEVSFTFCTYVRK